MNLCFVNYSFAGTADRFSVSGKTLIGGGEVYLHDLCKLLQKHGHETTIVQGGRVQAHFEVDGIPVVQVKSASRYRFNWDWKRGIPHGTDFVHLHDANHAYPLAGMENTATFHGVSWDVPYSGLDPVSYSKWAARNAFFKFLIKFAVKRCRRIVSVDTVLPRFVSHHLPRYSDKTVVIPNYVDLSKFKPKSVKGSRQSGKRIILLPRNLTKNRGIDLALAAFELLDRDDVQLWVAGTGPLQPLVESAASKNSDVVYLGHKDHYKELPALYNQADVVLVPSRGVEGTSLSVLEAMACGTPVIASNVGGLPDIITHEKDGLLCTPSAHAIAHSLQQILDHPALEKRLATAAKSRAKDFSKQVWEKRWLGFVEEEFRA